MRVRISKEAWAAATAAALTAAAVALAGIPGAAPAGAVPDPGSIVTGASGTWGACGSWSGHTAADFGWVSICGIDGMVAENGRPTQLAEPLVSVSRSVCTSGRKARCTEESYQGTARRTEMTVDPLLRRATIRTTLGACALDVEFAGVSPVRPQGNLWESHGLAGTPSVSLGAGQGFTNTAQWWGHVCGQFLVATDEGGGWMFRSVNAAVSGFSGPGGEAEGGEG